MFVCMYVCVLVCYDMIINANLDLSFNCVYIFFIANILAPILIILLPQLAKHTKSGMIISMMMLKILMMVIITMIVVTTLMMIMRMMIMMIIHHDDYDDYQLGSVIFHAYANIITTTI